MKTYVEIYNPSNKNYTYLIKDDNSRMTATHVYNSISMGYMGVELKVFDDNFQFMLRSRELIEELNPDPRKALECAGYVKTEPDRLEKMLYSEIYI